MAGVPEESLNNKTETVLTMAQRAMIERNRQKALLVKQANSNKRALSMAEHEARSDVRPSKVLDTGGGFLLEEETTSTAQLNVVHPPGAVLDGDALICEECNKPFMESYLFDKFTKLVCNDCKDMDGKHRLITKSDAKNNYLLKDVDVDERKPVLRYILKKNPHHSKWGEMKLYLESQVADRALEIWGSDEKLEEEKEKRSLNREKLKKKKFDKKVNELRKAVRSSLYKKTTAGHQHDFGPESYNEADDTYTKICKTCEHSVTFEKM